MITFIPAVSRQWPHTEAETEQLSQSVPTFNINQFYLFTPSQSDCVIIIFCTGPDSQHSVASAGSAESTIQS